MKSAHQIVESLVDGIRLLYGAPEETAHTLAELDGLLLQLHWHWADATDRMDDFVQARWAVFESDLLGWRQIHMSAAFHAMSDHAEHFRPIVDEWKRVDAILDIPLRDEQ